MRIANRWAVGIGAMLAASNVAASAPQDPPMPGGPVPEHFVIGTKQGNVLENLPPRTRMISPFGERAVISPDGRKVAFVDHFLGNAFEYDIASGTTRNLTAHTPHLGISRIHYLPDGSYVLVAPRELDKTPQLTRRSKLELFWLDAKASGPLQALNQPVYEGIGVSRTSNKVAWSVNQPRVHPFEPGAQGTTAMMVGNVVVTDGHARLVGTRTLKTTAFNECALEAQDILPGDTAVLGPCYNTNGKDGGHRIWSVALSDGKVTEYPAPMHLYGEVEGMFPDGKRAFTECGNSHKQGLDLCLIELKANKPRYTRITYAQDYGNYRFSNPTVGPDGKLVAFQFGYASDEAGMGRGIFLMEFPPIAK